MNAGNEMKRLRSAVHNDAFYLGPMAKVQEKWRELEHQEIKYGRCLYICTLQGLQTRGGGQEKRISFF
jgi:hypothetical protein